MATIDLPPPGESGETWPTKVNNAITAVNVDAESRLPTANPRPTGTLAIPAAGDVRLYNTADETTNYERAILRWSSNLFRVVTEAGGTGIIRNIELATSNRYFTIVDAASSSGIYRLNGASGVVGSNGLVYTGTWTAASGANAIIALTPTINQSGTAGYTALLIDITETAVGSGPKNFIDAKVNGATKFRVDSFGKIANHNGMVQRINNTASTTTPTPNADTQDQYNLTTLGVNATFSAPTGTPSDGQKLLIRVKADGTNRTVGWNAIYRAIGTALPVTAFANKTFYVNCIYNSADTKWDVVGVAVEA